MMQSMTQIGKRLGRRGGAALVIAAVLLVALTGTLALGLLRPVSGGAQDGAGAGASQEMPPMPVDVAVARMETVADVVRATGHIEAIQAVELRPDEQGRVVRILVREGQSVAVGTPLIRVDDAMLRAHAERASADRDLARQQLERVLRLRAQNAATPADLERAEAAARSAEAALSLLELQIQRTTVRAPFGGVVGQRFVSVGDYVTTNTPLLTLQSVNPQHVVIDVPERHAVSLRRGQTVEFTVAAQPERTFTAQVDFIDPVVQDENRTILVKARAPNGDRVLMPGMFVEARLATGSRPGAVLVPEDAVQPLRTGNVIWTMVDGRASRRLALLGTRSRGMVEVLSGVEAGEKVVVGGLERMAEGMPIAERPRELSVGNGRDGESVDRRRE